MRPGALARDLRLWESEISESSTIGSQLSCLPIEQVGAQLRRLRAVVDGLPDQVSFVRWEGVMRAYDNVLCVACQQLQLPTDLLTIGFGRARDLERLRLEGLLGQAGLPVR